MQSLDKSKNVQCNVNQTVTIPLSATVSNSSVLRDWYSVMEADSAFHVNLRLTYIILSAELTERLAMLT